MQQAVPPADFLYVFEFAYELQEAFSDRYSPLGILKQTRIFRMFRRHWHMPPPRLVRAAGQQPRVAQLYATSLGRSQGGFRARADRDPLRLGHGRVNVQHERSGGRHVGRDEGTPVSISPEMKWTLRASRSSLAISKVTH